MPLALRNTQTLTTNFLAVLMIQVMVMQITQEAVCPGNPLRSRKLA